MSPTCTIPYEVLLEIYNTTHHPVTMQVQRREDGEQAGPVIYLHEGESISLVLTAGVAYKYAIKQPPREAELSVKIWSDTQCSLVDVFKAPSSPQRRYNHSGIIVTEGIIVSSKAFPSPSPPRQPVSATAPLSSETG
ncbi:hypothetical protein BD414DRAFT_420109 [Trametes punicea]|nr:hypothetical protein BD414DRAFT_420109 [Trametes punicea]